jgi:hypothetical protein
MNPQLCNLAVKRRLDLAPLYRNCDDIALGLCLVYFGLRNVDIKLANGIVSLELLVVLETDQLSLQARVSRLQLGLEGAAIKSNEDVVPPETLALFERKKLDGKAKVTGEPSFVQGANDAA